MSEWPDNLKTGPVREWPGALTPDAARKSSPFMTADPARTWRRRPVPLSDTLELLDRELRMIHARDAEMLVAIAPQDFRLDGKPRAQAKAAHPGIILSFTTAVGRLSYPCDTFTEWQANLRAVALALEALRKVDRYGVTKRGEQYRGFLAIEGVLVAPTWESVVDVTSFLHTVIPDDWTTTFGLGADDLRLLLRQAKRAAHPDLDGDAVTFQRVMDAEKYLTENGAI